MGNIGVNPDGTYFVIGAFQNYVGPRYLNHFTDCPNARSYGGARAGDTSYRDQEATEARQSAFDLPGGLRDRYRE